VKVTLSGGNEVPPVTTSASGEGTISVADDGTVSGSVTTKGVQGTAAHIHMGAAGKNGPVLVPFTKEGDTFKAPAGAKLNMEQLNAFKAGELYFNVHSAANPGGEIRGQLK
jgi:CHRD domain